MISAGDPWRYSPVAVETSPYRSLRVLSLFSGWAGIFSLTLVSVKLLLEAGFGILDRQQSGQRSLECLAANSADSDRWNAS
jgi:hypothetical protein